MLHWPYYNVLQPLTKNLSPDTKRAIALLAGLLLVSLGGLLFIRIVYGVYQIMLVATYSEANCLILAQSVKARQWRCTNQVKPLSIGRHIVCDYEYLPLLNVSWVPDNQTTPTTQIAYSSINAQYKRSNKTLEEYFALYAINTTHTCYYDEDDWTSVYVKRNEITLRSYALWTVGSMFGVVFLVIGGALSVFAIFSCMGKTKNTILDRPPDRLELGVYYGSFLNGR